METPKRIQRKRTKGWRKPENTVNVCRPSKWGNPFVCDLSPTSELLMEVSFDLERMKMKEGSKDKIFHIIPYARAIVVQKFESYCLANPKFIEEIKTELKGKNLMCFCPLDSPCHADVLLKIANE